MSVVCVIKETLVMKSRKNYKCDACEYVVNAFDYTNFSFSEKKKIVKARANKWKILKGEPHIDQFNRNSDGDTYHFKAIPEIHKLCIKYELYLDE